MKNTLRSLSVLALLLAFAPGGRSQTPGEDPGDTGSITFNYGGTTVTYTLVRAADGNVWLQQNLGATQVATSAADATAYGHLYQWGRWTDGHQEGISLTAPASGLSPNNPAGLGVGAPMFYIGPNPNDWWSNGTDLDTWGAAVPSTTNGVDPCVALGIGWQLPSRTDWIDVIAAESITGTASAFASNLKLTAAGSRDGGNGMQINTGAYGNYWSSTPNSVYAKDVTIGELSVNPDDDAYRSYGMCLRCLHKGLHTGVDDRMQEDRLTVYPNPSSGTFTVDNGGELVRTVRLYTSDMRLVHTEAMNATKRTVTLEQVPAGIYLMRIEAATGTTWRTIAIER